MPVFRKTHHAGKLFDISVGNTFFMKFYRLHDVNQLN